MTVLPASSPRRPAGSGPDSDDHQGRGDGARGGRGRIDATVGPLLGVPARGAAVRVWPPRSTSAVPAP